jgi:hypothetical protein
MGNVSVRIYDMQYSPKNVASGSLAAELPPSVTLRTAASRGTSEVIEPGKAESFGSGPTLNAGVYLIRASIAFDNNVTNKIDASIVQNANPEA